MKAFDIKIEYCVRVESRSKKNAEGIAWTWMVEDAGREHLPPNFKVSISEVKE